MNYTIEARQVTQSMYGGYCSMCRKLSIKTIPYHNFTIEEYNRIKELYKTYKYDTR